MYVKITGIFPTQQFIVDSYHFQNEIIYTLHGKEESVLELLKVNRKYFSLATLGFFLQHTLKTEISYEIKATHRQSLL